MTWTCGHVAARALAAAALAVAAVGLAGPPVSARVTVDPTRAESGVYTTLAFSVSTERTDVSTTKVEIRFPDDHPMPGLTTEPKPGWDVTVEKIRTGAVSPSRDGAADEATEDPTAGVTWSASTSDAAIAPGRFELFRISVGPFPSGVDLLLFEARQTYSDGDVDSWDGQPAGDSDDPASAGPAPTLALMDQASTDLLASSSAPAPVASPEPTPLETALSTENTSAATEDTDDRSAEYVTLGFAAGGVLIFGAIAATAFARRRDGDAPKLPGA